MIAGGHIHGDETLNLLFGHLLYGLLIGSIALFAAAAVSESSATAAIIVLAVTIGSWVLDFTAPDTPACWDGFANFADANAAAFEQGLLSAGLVIGMSGAILGFTLRRHLAANRGSMRTEAVALRHLWSWHAPFLAAATAVRRTADVTEDRRNSFPAADQKQLKLSGLLAMSRSTSLRKTRDFWICKETSFQSSNVPCQASPSTWRAGRAATAPTATVSRLLLCRSRRHEQVDEPPEILPLIYGLAGVRAAGGVVGSGLSWISIGPRRPLGGAVVLRPAAFSDHHLLVAKPPSAKNHPSL
jgi:hypothetical protein